MIVYHSFIDNTRIEWNGQGTYNVFYGTSNVDCFTRYGAENARIAGRYAREWLIANRWN
jgi:hypothetical protein